MTEAHQEPAHKEPSGGWITIGIREYRAATGEIVTVREPQRFTGEAPPPLDMRFPLCQCPQAPACHKRRADL